MLNTKNKPQSPLFIPHIKKDHIVILRHGLSIYLLFYLTASELVLELLVEVL